MFFTQRGLRARTHAGQRERVWPRAVRQLSGGFWLAGFRLVCCLRLPFGPNGH